MGTATALAAPRTVYVWFGGLGTKGDAYGNDEKKMLVRNGVAANDVIVHESPFPYIPAQESLDGYFAVDADTMAENLNDYTEWSKPDSAFSTEQHDKVKAELQQAGVTSADHIVLLGHSAGAQAAATEADRLTQDGQYHVQSVVTMGGPFTTNFTPTTVQLAVVESPVDEVLAGTDKIPGITRLPANFTDYPNRLHITMASVMPDGRPNSHGSYLLEHNLPRILAEIAKPHTSPDFSLPS